MKIINPMLIGYSTLITLIIFFSGIQILFLGLIGEYIGKILQNINKENQYFISEIKKNKKMTKTLKYKYLLKKIYFSF